MLSIALLLLGGWRLWPGVGKQAWRAIRDENIPMIMGTVLCSAVTIVFLNLLIDLLYLVLDPRVRLEGRR